MTGSPSRVAWPATAREAVAVQERLRGQVRLHGGPRAVRRIAGVDTAFTPAGEARAAAVVFSYPALEPLAEAVAVRRPPMPYVPGFLSFRELPAVLAALEGLAEPPDLVLCDGQGIAHPRRLGIAAHLGVLTGLAAVGVAKSRLIGEHAEPGRERGARTPLRIGDEVVGTVLRTRAGVRPLYVSPGHRMAVAAAADWVLACCTRYRLPEPVRAADRLAAGRPVTAQRP